VNHLKTDVGQSAIQAGRLLIRAIDADAFPKSRKKKNGDWWDRSRGRVPGGPVAVFGSIDWAPGQPAPDRSPKYLAAVTKPSTAAQFQACWTFAIGSWLVRSFPDRFRHGAAEADWRHAVLDAVGCPVGRDGKPLTGRWYKNGKRLPKSFEWSPDCGGGYTWRREGEVAYEKDSYDQTDWLARLRIRAEVYADACLALADLLSDTGRRGGKRGLDAGNKLKSAAKREIVFEFIKGHRFAGTLKQLAAALSKEKGLEISTSQLSRYSATTRMKKYMGTPARTLRRKGEREAIAKPDIPPDLDG
jgi:hypothetical protein